MAEKLVLAPEESIIPFSYEKYQRRIDEMELTLRQSPDFLINRAKRVNQDRRAMKRRNGERAFFNNEKLIVIT